MSSRAYLLGLILVLLCAVSAGQTQASQPAPSQFHRDKTYAKYVDIAGAERVGSDKCAGCHNEITKTYRRTTHFQQDLGCEDCHGSGSLHAENGDKAKIIAVRARKAETADGVCLSCHVTNEQLANWSAGAHERNHVRCADCHKVHVAEIKAESRLEKNQACLRCHHKQESQGMLPYHHPVREAKMSCDDCHNPHGGSTGNNLKAVSVNELCFQCHAEMQGPFTYQHAPVTENCSKCHTPHGSAQRNLLNVSEPMLCLQCHSAHHNGSGTPLMNRCTNCHSSIHGSDIPSATGGSLFMDK